MTLARKIKPLDATFTQEWIAQARSDVDHVFNTAADRYENIRQNPFTGGHWVPRLDPTKPQKEDAVRAVLARRWHAKYGPPGADLQRLPLGYEERELLKRGGATHILAWYARSLDNLDYDVVEHPSFYDYACGVMVCEFAPESIREDEQLKRRFPPRPLSGLGGSLYWEPPEDDVQRPHSTRSKVNSDE
jgi:hypothetical protein